MRFKLGELYCGPGGIGYAAKTAKIKNSAFGITHAWATDYDKDTCLTYSKNVADGSLDSVICEDIRKIDFKKLQSISDIDALAFGFPCNDFSIVGEQKGIDGVFGPLYSYGIKALNHFRPAWFLAENVGGLRNSNDGNTFKQILREMHETGYSVYPNLYKFEQYGLPQARHRIIIIGIRSDLNVEFKIPSNKPYEKKAKSCREA